MSNDFKTDTLAFELPLTRAAYSDRTAWLMAEMSALAYEKFEGELSLKQEINNITPETKFVGEAQINLNRRLESANFSLVRTFNLDDTQAFLATRTKDKIAILAFRGTEANKWKDVQTDIKIWTKKSSDGTKVHSGFATAYSVVESAVRDAVSHHCGGYALYITGHSLGGALAVIAAKELEEKANTTIAACYTFGSPRVGNEELGEKIKAPVYRVVNAADGVPRVPLMSIGSYIHFGDLRYLTACSVNMNDLKLLENPSLPKRVVRLWRRWLAHGPIISGKDHGIDHYRNKLRHYAKQRN